MFQPATPFTLKKIGLLLLFLCLFVPAQAKAEQYGIYVTPKLIYGVENFKMKQSVSNATLNMGSHSESTFGGALALGYDFGFQGTLPIRAELEYATFTEVKATDSGHAAGRSYDASGKLDVDSLFINAYYDFHNETRFTPYVGGGFGFGFLSMKGDNNHNSYGSHDETNFAWNLGLGCAYQVVDGFAVDLGYRYVNLGEAKTSGTSSIGNLKTDTVGMHQFMLGGRFTF